MCPFLDLRWTRGAHQLAEAFHHVASSFAERWTRLRSVSLFGSSIDLDLLRQLQECLSTQLAFLSIESKTLTDAGLHLLAACSHLRTFRVPNCPRITSDGLAAVFACAPDLQDVDVSGCSRVNDTAVLALARHCPQLVSLNLSQLFRLTNDSLQALGAGCPRLTHLKTDRCLKFSQAGFSALAGLRELQALDVSSCLRVGDSLAPLCAASAGSLTSINVSGCSSITDGTLLTIVHHVGPRLQFLSVAGCDKLTEAAIGELNGATCPRLTHLRLGKVPAVTDAVLVDAVSTLPLKCLAVNGCVHVSDPGVAAVAAGCGGTLQRLSLEYCFRVTNVGLDALAAHCPHLASLNVRICDKMTLPGFETLAAKCPALRTVKLSGVHTQSETSAIVSCLRRAQPACSVSL